MKEDHFWVCLIVIAFGLFAILQLQFSQAKKELRSDVVGQVSNATHKLTKMAEEFQQMKQADENIIFTAVPDVRLHPIDDPAGEELFRQLIREEKVSGVVRALGRGSQVQIDFDVEAEDLKMFYDTVTEDGLGLFIGEQDGVVSVVPVERRKQVVAA